MGRSLKKLLQKKKKKKKSLLENFVEKQESLGNSLECLFKHK